MPEEITSFPPEVAAHLGTYVYRLIDPRNGETFYVGQGTGDRVFAHIRGHVDEQEDVDVRKKKLLRIRDIRRDGFKVAHVIHRHGMDKNTAMEVEAALIDAYPGLTNIAGGHGDPAMHVDVIIRLYSAEEAKIQHKALLVNISRSEREVDSLLEAAQYAWKLSPAKAEQAEVILATIQGIIREVFFASEWLEATREDGEPWPGRYSFVGTEAPEPIRSLYKDKRVPEIYRKKGAANPVRYTW